MIAAVLVGLGVVLYLICVACVLMAGVAVLRAVAVFLRAYAMCFVGGRYEALGRSMSLPERVAPPPMPDVGLAES